MPDLKIDTTNLANVLVTNPGLVISRAALDGLIVGSIRAHGGCIQVLRYGDNSRDLDYVSFDSGDSLSSATTTNLSEFASAFQEAANHGLRVTYCQDVNAKRIFMVNLWPCGCSCRDGKSQTAG